MTSFTLGNAGGKRTGEQYEAGTGAKETGLKRQECRLRGAIPKPNSPNELIRLPGQKTESLFLALPLTETLSA